MGYIKNNASRVGYTLRTKVLKNWKFGKSHNVNEVKTIGSVCNVILMQSCHERTKGIGQEECVVSSANAVLLHSYAVAIGSVLHWMSHLQCCLLITQSALVKM